MRANMPAGDARRIIDQDILNHETSILELKTRRNALAPIAKLPPEILCRIFTSVKDAAEKYQRSPVIWSVRRWIGVSHVSRHWRSIAVNAPILWTKLPLTSLNWTSEMLKRSKMVGLEVELYPSSLGTNSAVLQHISHIKSLKIHEASSSTLQSMFSSLPEEASQLECLSISHAHTNLSYPTVEKIKLSSTMFRGTNRLRRLTLLRVDIAWDSHLLNGLTELALRQVSSEARPTWKQMMDMLERIPNVESLDLQRVFPNSDTPCAKPIHLAHLKNLTIDSVTPEVQAFFSHVTLPRLQRLNVGSHTKEAGEVDYSGILCTLSQSCSTENLGVNIRSLAIYQRMSSTYGLCFEGFSDLTKPRKTNAAMSELELLFGPPAGEGSFQDYNHFNNKIVADVFGGLSLINLTELVLRGGIHINSRTMVDRFGKLPQLSSVTVSDSTAKELIKALEVQILSSGDAEFCFSRLSSITMDGVSFDPWRASDLQDCFMHRYEHGVEVRDLHLRECLKLNEETVNLLAEIVVDVDWDEEELGFEDSEEEEDAYVYGDYFEDDPYYDEDDFPLYHFW